MREPAIAVVVGLAVRDGDVLMGQRRPCMSRPGMWEYPGGKTERGENLRGALMREWREELGLDVNVGKGLGDDDGLVLAMESVYRLYLYEVRFAGDPPESGTDHSSICWLDPRRAIVGRPMVPSAYLFYRTVLAHLEDCQDRCQVCGAPVREGLVYCPGLSSCWRRGAIREVR